MSNREMQRDAAAERVPEEIGARDMERVEQIAHVVHEGGGRVVTPRDRLVGESMTAKIEGDDAPPAASERVEEVAEGVDARAPSVNQYKRRFLDAAGLENAQTESARQPN